MNTEYKLHQKAVKTIKSCKTEKQYAVAMRFLCLVMVRITNAEIYHDLEYRRFLPYHMSKEKLPIPPPPRLIREGVEIVS